MALKALDMQKLNSRFQVEKFDLANRNGWDSYVDSARTPLFLFKRDYMEYHADRYPDFSIIVRGSEQIAAIFPATGSESRIYSHAGLSFGGLLASPEIRLRGFIEVYFRILLFLRKAGFNELIVKQIPSFLRHPSSEAEDYALFLAGGQLYRRDANLVVQPREYKISSRKLRSVKKAISSGVVTLEDQSLVDFWRDVLEPNLASRHGAKPVHSVDEIILLKDRFPAQIRLYTSHIGNEMVAGILVYEYGDAIHCQYISSTDKGRKVGALDLLVHNLITKWYSARLFISLGTSNREDGKVLNVGLAEWKEGFNANTYCHNFIKVSLDSDFESLSCHIER